MKNYKSNYNTSFFALVLILLCYLAISCKNSATKSEDQVEINADSIKPQATLDDQFDKLLIKDSGGVTGADGVISFPLNNGKSVFMMGDSFVSEVIDNKRDPESKMINNTFIEVDLRTGESKSIIGGNLQNPETMLLPVNAEMTKEYYWPGHGFQNDNVIHVFMSKFWNDPTITSGWNFKFKGTDYIRLEPDTYRVISQNKFAATDVNGVHYGHSVLKDDDYTYIYGSKVNETIAELHVIRSTVDSLSNSLTNFEIFDGKNWINDATKTAGLKGIKKNVPEQFSVFKYENYYVLVMEERELAGNIYSYISNSPSGPWRNEKLLFEPTESNNKKDEIITYNAMAHAQYIKDNKLLVSYCVNSMHPPNIHNIDVEYYRPRFFWVPMDLILSE